MNANIDETMAERLKNVAKAMGKKYFLRYSIYMLITELLIDFIPQTDIGFKL